MKHDNEEEKKLVNMVCETNEDVRNSLYETYEQTINYFVLKYSKLAKKVGIENKDLYQEALVGFTDAINNYDETKDASLKTFVSLCIDRRLKKIIEKYTREKHRINHESLSLEYEYFDLGNSLLDIIGTTGSDPLEQFSKEEKMATIDLRIKQISSPQEYIVYDLLKNGLTYQEIAKKLDKTPKQIDNTMQRIRNKIKLIIEKEDL